MKQLRPLLLASIAAFAPACPSTMFCDPPERDFTKDGELAEAEVEDVIAFYGLAGREAIDCEIACEFIYERDEGWQVTEVDTCTGAVSPMPTPGATVAATIGCTGHAIEYYCEGRRPAGHVELVADGSGLGHHLAHCAYLEAAAVTAFDDLVHALRHWGAPAPLVARCLRARAQELEHARDVGALATRHGATLTAPTRVPRAPSRLALALDNAVEGCVHEAWAALRAQWMATHAHDRDVRALYAKIADDELEHAQLSWDLHAWLLGTLDADGRDQVERALAAALAELPALAEVQARTSPAVLGLPAPATARALARDFCGRLAA